MSPEIQKIHPSLLRRKVIHIDMDAFFAAVEIRDNPQLAGKPVIIGGKPQSRGVVCTCSYEARQFGIHSAMACSKAYQLCPDGIFISPNFEKYRDTSDQIRQIFKKYTELVEPISLDEAYLDVTGHSLYASEIAKRIKQEILNATRLTGSAGVAPNKLLAKIASDIRKPNGLTTVKPHQVLSFMKNLPLRKINGVGPVTEKKLLAQGMKVCQDVWRYELPQLEQKLNARIANWLYQCSRGIDERLVQPTRIRKSLGLEKTFAADILDLAQLQTTINVIGTDVANLLVKKHLRGKCITLKIKYSNFKQITRSKTIDTYTDSREYIINTAKSLLNKTEAHNKPVRLVGVTVSNFQSQIS